MKEIISWLFKDPINSGLAQFAHAQSNSKKWPKGYENQIALNEFFSQKTTNKIFTYLLAPFIGQILKKFFQQIQSYEHAQLLGPKWPIFPNKYFFSENLLMSLISFIHAYLHAKNQSPDINLLLKYWQLKNTEISLADSHFWL